MNEIFEQLLKQACEAGLKAANAVDLNKVCDGNGYVAVKLTINGKLARYKWSPVAVWYNEQYPEDRSVIAYDGVRHSDFNIPNNPYGGVAKKEAYAEAFCKVINQAGYYAFPYSRLD